MSWLDALRHRMRPLLRPREWQREHDEEVALHLELEAAQKRGGAEARVAAIEARVAFGHPTYYREETRRMTILGVLDVLRQDARYGWRALVRSPAFTLTAVLSLALGIGANTAIFGLVYAVLLEPLPLPRPDRLVVANRVVERSKFPGGPGGFTLPEFDALRQSPGVRLASSTATGNVRVEARGLRDPSNVDLVDGAWFNTLGLRPVAGRFISADDEQAARPVVVISELLWERWFQRETAAIGSTLTLHGASFTVIGVAPRAFHGLLFPGQFALAVPITTASLLGLPDLRSARGATIQLVGRLTDNSTLATASTSVAAIFSRCCANGELAPSAKGNAPPQVSRASLGDMSHGIPFGKFDIRTNFGRLLLIIMAGVGVVLLIACANVGNLLLARATARTREFAVRLSLGASRGRVVRQLLTESLQLALLGGVLGFFLAWAGTNALVRSLPGNLVMVADIVGFRLKPALLLFTLGMSVLCVFVFGLVPALRATKTDLVTPLKEGGEARAGRRAGMLDRSLVVAQVALALLLVSSAGLLGATLRNLRDVDGGFATSHVLLVTVDTRGTSRERDGAVPMHAELLDRIRRVSGVRLAAMSMNTPVYGGRTSMGPIDVPGSDIPGDDGPHGLLNPVTPGYFAASGIALASGRDFDANDRPGAATVVVISESLAKRFFAGRDPVGHQIRMGGEGGETMTIVGVARDAKYHDLRGDADQVLYTPVAQETGGGWPFVVITARTTGEPAALGAELRAEILAFAPDLRMVRPQAMEDAMNDALARERLAAGLAAVFAAVALGLAAMGLYGVVAYNVARRTPEIGVRMALGARARDVVWYVLRGSLMLVAVGVLVGAPLTFLAGKAVAAMLFGVGAHDPLLLAGAALLLTAVAVAASAVPAARAARIDPLRALRRG